MSEASDWDRAEITRLLEKATSWKQQMIKRRLSRGRAKCPTCQQPESMVVLCNIEGNKHLSCHCEFCGANFME